MSAYLYLVGRDVLIRMRRLQVFAALDVRLMVVEPWEPEQGQKHVVLGMTIPESALSDLILGVLTSVGLASYFSFSLSSRPAHHHCHYRSVLLGCHPDVLSPTVVLSSLPRHLDQDSPCQVKRGDHLVHLDSQPLSHDVGQRRLSCKGW